MRPSLFSSLHSLAFVAAVAAVVPGGVARGDVITLTSGKVVEGAIVSESGSQYVVQTEVGTIQVGKSDVARVVNMGTSALEIQGDIALKKGDTAGAQAAWKQALTGLDTESVAAKRLTEKLGKLNATTRQSSANQIAQLFQQAQELLQSQQYDAAEKAIGNIESQLASARSKFTPTNQALATADNLTSQVRRMKAEMHYGKGIAARDAVRMDVSQREFEQAILIDPAFYPPYLALGDSMLDNSATVARGIELVQQGLTAGGDRVPEQQRYAQQYRLGQKYFDQKDYARAAATYAALIPARENYPAYADALDKAVESYVKMGEENLSSDFGQTITTLNTALRLNPRNEKALFLLGRIYLDMGQLENAVITLGRLVEMKPTYPDAQFYLGHAYLKTHDYQTAIKHLSREIAANSNNYKALVDRAEAEIATGDFTGAERDLANARALDPGKWTAHYLSGRLAFQQNNYPEALKALTQALQSNSAAIPAHLLMARVLDAQNKPDDARKWLDQVTTRLKEAQPLSYDNKVHLADALTQLGEISMKGNSPRQADNYLNEALQVLPNYAPALTASADAMLLLSKDAFATAPPADLKARAEALYQRAIAVEPQEASHYLKLANFYRESMNDAEKAKTYYNQYVDHGGRDSRVNGWLTQVGGAPRSEITAAAAAAAVASAPAFTVPTITTATVTMTSGSMGTFVTTNTESAPLTPTFPALNGEAQTTASVVATSGTVPGMQAPGAVPGMAPEGSVPGMQPPVPGQAQPAGTVPGMQQPTATVPPEQPGV